VKVFRTNDSVRNNRKYGMDEYENKKYSGQRTDELYHKIEEQKGGKIICQNICSMFTKLQYIN
jgi:hypothetical protein